MPEIGKIYQDQVYDAKVLSRLAVEIIDSGEFQRLSELRQLGYSNIVFRGARHTRFEHSIGTYFISRTIMRRIVQNHERLGLEHPGEHLADVFKFNPPNTDLPQRKVTKQSKWRGLTEVVSAAALLHDLGHVPFGHTLEDEYAGLFKRHDNMGGARLYKMMFDDASELARVFTDRYEPWFEKITNRDLGQLIYVLLNWGERTDPRKGFDDRLREAKDKATTQQAVGRLNDLEDWYRRFTREGIFHPFMSDIVGNTICADLLDYLPRDRKNLGMEPRFHSRLQRYITVRRGTLYPGEGLRLSIMVTRMGHGGQRRDVATEVLAIMRERYEMAERVFYHHKKAAASAMLAKLYEITAERSRPRDDEDIYPAPWSHNGPVPSRPPHMVHLSDSELVEYLGHAELTDSENSALQRRLYVGLRFRRKGIYRTLLVLDTDLVRLSAHKVAYFVEALRGSEEKPSSEGRNSLERQLEEAAKLSPGSVILYCPSADMQSKEVDARLEIKQSAVLPLRVQREFAYFADVRVLQEYYSELWRMYVFVDPGVFDNASQCKTMVDALCDHFHIPRTQAYLKVRTHKFDVAPNVTAQRLLGCVDSFLSALPFDLPSKARSQFLSLVAKDEGILGLIGSESEAQPRLLAILESSIMVALKSEPAYNSKEHEVVIDGAVKDILDKQGAILIKAWAPGQPKEWDSFDQYRKDVIERHLGELRLPLDS